MKDHFICINSISHPVTNLGLGRRIVLWVQGCSLKCRGCMAVSMQTRRTSNKQPVLEIFTEIKKASYGLDGITISGGEPFEQSVALYELVTLIKRETHLDIMVYSGYTIIEIKSHGETANKVLNEIDILIDGRFEKPNTNKKLWRGSDNQEFHILSNRAEKYANYINMEYNGKRELCLEMRNDNSFKIIGIPEREFSENIQKRLFEKGFTLIK